MSLRNPKPGNRAGRSVILATLTACALLAPPVSAFDLDSDAPITVNADSARLDDSQGIATYTGDVVVTQLNTQLTADRVVLYRGESGLNRIEATGQPAHYFQPSNTLGEATDARAHIITYSAPDHRLTLEREAVIEQGGNLFRGERIHYDTENRVVTAEGSADGNNGQGRVEMVIQPRNRPLTEPRN
ncbi:MAG: lipopolysaccharide transport periplasmic protein LptA [Marinobacter sp.]|uniref:lipopolysaccharide transport periplasmic protein LptA n=1 Tax=Marinobacter sp. TaxID=50741 RepID=UPI00299DECB1|nr:lipopolysaccharide transport periplasmic protein LptA [Marinobacter sp.]MDX1756725.1 lipopolysaccharide transport periplasmic protein LptA [Marinobacter sp.]